MTCVCVCVRVHLIHMRCTSFVNTAPWQTGWEMACCEPWPDVVLPSLQGYHVVLEYMPAKPLFDRIVEKVRAQGTADQSLQPTELDATFSLPPAHVGRHACARRSWKQACLQRAQVANICEHSVRATHLYTGSLQ